jgi:RNA polymerase sigma factor (sigma-70 family)
VNSPFASVRAVVAVLARQQYADSADAELLRRFAANREEAAFAELVRRYGPLVWRAARTAAGNDAIAEDAFQATFLALARHAGSLRRPAALVGWLHRTARRAAGRARRVEAKRSFPRAPTEPAACADPLDRLTARELLTAVEEEIAALPEAFRVVLLLCGVEGISQEEAAARLGWSPGSVKGRLERARARLRKRLALRGLTAPTLLGGLVGGMPSALAETTLAAVRGGELSPAVAKLVAGASGMSASFWWKPALAVLFALGGLTFGLGGRSDGPPSDAVPRAAAAPIPKRPRAGKLVLWSAPAHAKTNPRLPAEPVQPLGISEAAVFTPDGRAVITSGNAWRGINKGRAGDVRVWDAATGNVVRLFAGTADNYHKGVAISPDGKFVAAGGDVLRPGGSDYVIDIWEFESGKRRSRLTGFKGIVSGVAFSPDGKLLAACGLDGSRGVWEVATEKVVHLVQENRPLRALAMHPSNGLYATIDEAGTFACWEMSKNGDSKGKFDCGEPSDPKSLAFAPDGRSLAIAGLIPKACLVAIMKCFRGKTFMGVMPSPPADPKIKVYQATFSPDGKLVAAACGDGTVRVYDSTTAKLRAAAKEHTEPVDSVAFSPDGKRLVTTGQDAVKMWSVAELLKRKPK